LLGGGRGASGFWWGGAHAGAPRLGGPAGHDLAASAAAAFTDALGVGLTAAAVVAFAGALLVLLRLPDSRAATSAAPRPTLEPLPAAR
jgi:hypothetical protein